MRRPTNSSEAEIPERNEPKSPERISIHERHRQQPECENRLV